jgi:hypothetical protein
VERSPDTRRGGYIIDFWGVGFDGAERMGLLPGIRREGYLVREVRVGALADRLADDESGRMKGTVMPLPLHILQLLLGHAEIMTAFMHESLPNLMTNFCLMGTDRLNVFLILDDVGENP